MSYRMKQACWPNCAPCGGPEIGAITCVSRQGNGTLRGWSKFQNQNSGDLNLRKYKRAHQSGEAICCVKSGSCASSWVSASGYSQWNVSTNSASNLAASLIGKVQNAINCAFFACGEPSCGDFTVDCSGPSPVFVRPTADLLTNFTSCSQVIEQIGAVDTIIDTFDRSWILAPRIRTIANATSVSWAGRGSLANALAFSGCTPEIDTVVTGGTISIQLSDPDSVSDALARGFPTVGVSCKTTYGAAGTTTAGVSTQISITGPRSVVATIPCSGLTNGTDYVVTVKINRYTSGGGSYVDFIYDTIEFTAGADTEDIEYDVPVNTDYDYEIDTSYKDIAAA